MSNEKVRIDYFSDILCVWAYVAQVRMDELQRQLGDRVEPRYRFVSVFGDVETKVGRGWRKRGGFDGYADHVREICDRFDHVTLGSKAWREDPPASSGMTHLLLKAVQLLDEEGALPEERGFEGRTLFEEAVWQARRSFFVEGLNVGRTEVMVQIFGDLGIPVGEVQARVADGSAAAALARDSAQAEKLGVTGSPTFVMNEGRQKLYGNVGYRILEANVEEVLHRPEDQASWC